MWLLFPDRNAIKSIHLLPQKASLAPSLHFPSHFQAKMLTNFGNLPGNAQDCLCGLDVDGDCDGDGDDDYDGDDVGDDDGEDDEDDDDGDDVVGAAALKEDGINTVRFLQTMKS